MSNHGKARWSADRPRCASPAPGGQLNASGPAEADRHAIAVDDHRDDASAVAVAEHTLQVCPVLLDVDVRERHVPPLIVFTGGQGIGSGVFAEDIDHAPDSTLRPRSVPTPSLLRPRLFGPLDQG